MHSAPGESLIRRLVPIALLVAATPGALARSPRTEAELGATYESLSDGPQDWKSACLDAAHSFEEHPTLAGGRARGDRA